MSNAPSAPAHPPQPHPNGEAEDHARPEAITYAVAVYFVLLALELINQVFNVVMSLSQFDTIKAQAQEAADASDTPVPESAVGLAAGMSIGLALIVSLTIIGVLAWLLTVVRRRGKRVDVCGTMLKVFGFYFVLRGLVVFFIDNTRSAVPVPLFAISGSLQIVIAVAAVIALIYLFNQESSTWLKKPTRN